MKHPEYYIHATYSGEEGFKHYYFPTREEAIHSFDKIIMEQGGLIAAQLEEISESFFYCPSSTTHLKEKIIKTYFRS